MIDWKRPRTPPPPAQGLSADEVRRLLSVIPDTPPGLRDRAIILMLVLTGRRRAEVFALTAGDLTFDAEVCFYQYKDKGGKTGRRDLPRPALDALRSALAAYGRELEHLSPHESLWPSPAARNGEGLRSATFNGRFSAGIWRRLVFPLRSSRLAPHSGQAETRRRRSIEDVSRFLDHSSLAVTSIYLRRLEGQEDRGWGRVAEATGL